MLLPVPPATKRPISVAGTPNFDRYVCDVHPKTWAATCKWADAVLFGNFLTVVDKAAHTGKGKGVGGTDRVIYTARRDAFDAKNRFGMPAELWLSDDPTESWGILWNSIAKGKNHDG